MVPTLRFKGHPPRLVSWTPPTTSFVALNVDGSVRGRHLRNELSGCLRNDEGDWNLGFNDTGGVSNILHMDILAILHGDLKLACDKADSEGSFFFGLFLYCFFDS